MRRQRRRGSGHQRCASGTRWCQRCWRPCWHSPSSRTASASASCGSGSRRCWASRWRCGLRGRRNYDLRRLRLRGLIERIAGTRRYRLTADGLRAALVFHRTDARVLRPSLAAALAPGAAPMHPATRCWSVSTENSSAYGKASLSPLKLDSNVQFKGQTRTLSDIPPSIAADYARAANHFRKAVDQLCG